MDSFTQNNQGNSFHNNIHNSMIPNRQNSIPTSMPSNMQNTTQGKQFQHFGSGDINVSIPIGFPTGRAVTREQLKEAHRRSPAVQQQMAHISNQDIRAAQQRAAANRMQQAAPNARIPSLGFSAGIGGFSMLPHSQHFLQQRTAFHDQQRAPFQTQQSQPITSYGSPQAQQKMQAHMLQQRQLTQMKTGPQQQTQGSPGFSADQLPFHGQHFTGTQPTFQAQGFGQRHNTDLLDFGMGIPQLPAPELWPAFFNAPQQNGLIFPAQLFEIPQNTAGGDPIIRPAHTPTQKLRPVSGPLQNGLNFQSQLFNREGFATSANFSMGTAQYHEGQPAMYGYSQQDGQVLSTQVRRTERNVNSSLAAKQVPLGALPYPTSLTTQMNRGQPQAMRSSGEQTTHNQSRPRPADLLPQTSSKMDSENTHGHNQGLETLPARQSPPHPRPSNTGLPPLQATSNLAYPGSAAYDVANAQAIIMRGTLYGKSPKWEPSGEVPVFMTSPFPDMFDDGRTSEIARIYNYPTLLDNNCDELIKLRAKLPGVGFFGHLAEHTFNKPNSGKSTFEHAVSTALQRGCQARGQLTPGFHSKAQRGDDAPETVKTFVESISHLQMLYRTLGIIDFDKKVYTYGGYEYPLRAPQELPRKLQKAYTWMKEPIPTLAMHYRANPWLKQYWETIQSDSGYDQNAVYQHANNGYTANAYQHAPTSNSSLVSHGMFNGRPAFMSSMPQAKPAVTDSDLGPYSPLSSSTTPQNEDSLNNGIATSKHLTGWKRKSDSEQFGMYHPSNPIDEEYVAALTTEPSDVRQQPQRPYHIVETQQETTDLPQEEEDLPQTGTPSTTVSSVQLPQFDSPSSVTVASTTDTPVTSLEMSDDGSISSPETPETENSLDNSPGPETQTSTNKKRSVGFSDEDYYGAKRAKLCQSGTDTGQASASPLPTANGHEAVLTTVSSTSEFVPTDHDYLIRDLVEYLLHHFTRTVSSTRFDKKVAGLYCAKFPVLEAKTSAQQILSRSKCKTLEELENKAVAAAHSGKIMAHLRVANKDINGSKFCEQPASTDLDIGARALPHTGVEVEAIPSQEKTMGFLKFPTDASIEDYDIPLLGSEHISNTPRSARPGALVPPTAGPESGAYEELPEMEFTEDFWKEDTFGSGFPE